MPRTNCRSNATPCNHLYQPFTIKMKFRERDKNIGGPPFSLCISYSCCLDLFMSAREGNLKTVNSLVISRRPKNGIRCQHYLGFLEKDLSIGQGYKLWMQSCHWSWKKSPLRLYCTSPASSGDTDFKWEWLASSIFIYKKCERRF